MHKKIFVMISVLSVAAASEGAPNYYYQKLSLMSAQVYARAQPLDQRLQNHINANVERLQFLDPKFRSETLAVNVRVCCYLLPVLVAYQGLKSAYRLVRSCNN